MSKFTLKQYQTMLDKKLAERESLISDLKSIQDKIALNKEEQISINREIFRLKEKVIEPVTEHAIVRYLERVKKMDMTVLKQEILDKVSALFPYSGEVKTTLDGQRYKFVIKDKQVISVVDL